LPQLKQLTLGLQPTDVAAEYFAALVNVDNRLFDCHQDNSVVLVRYLGSEIKENRALFAPQTLARTLDAWRRNKAAFRVFVLVADAAPRELDHAAQIYQLKDVFVLGFHCSAQLRLQAVDARPRSLLLQRFALALS